MFQPASLNAIGMVTSLGLDWMTSCAAARAGITRATQLPYFRFRTADTGEVTTAQGHPVELLGAGFEGSARLVRLMTGALKDLLRNAPSAELFKEAHFYLSVPHPARPFLGANLITDVATREKQLPMEQEAEGTPDTVIHDSTTELLARAARLAKWPGPTRLVSSSAAGHVGVAILLQQALQDLSDGTAQAVIVGGVDSLLGEDTLNWLLNTGRLKTPSTASGLMPGEGAVVFHLSPRHSSGPPLLRDIALESEESSFLSNAQPTGRTLASAVSRVAKGHSCILFSDHNGEVYRGSELGNVLLRVQAAVPGLDFRDIHFPAQSFGDTGAASGAIAIAHLVGLSARRVLIHDFGIAMSSSDGPQRAAVLIERGRIN